MASSVFANIALDIEAPELRDRLFTYGVPDLLQDQVFVGSCVLVPFGRQGQNVVSGYVVSLEDSTAKDFKVKDVFEVMDASPFFDSEYIDFLHWLANTYCANLADVIAAALPSSISPRLKRRVRLVASVLKTSTDNGSSFRSPPEGERLFSILAQSGESSLLALRRRYQDSTKSSASSFYKALNWLKRSGNIEVLAEAQGKVLAKSIDLVEIAPDLENKDLKISPRQQKIIDTLKEQEGKIPLAQLIKLASTTSNTIKKMHESGLLVISKEDSIRDPLQAFAFKLDKNSAPKQLTAHQTKCLSVLEKELDLILNNEQTLSPKEPVAPWLLFGVTGSGKTEVYLQLIEKTVKSGKTVLIMVPEIGLTSQLVSLLNDRFPELVSIWHSAVSAGERFDTWRRIRDGSVKILLGARSAVLANIPNLGLIILDEEHDSSYKQTSPSPRYNAKDVALEKARRHNALVLFGSATPDLSTYYHARKANKILTLPERVFSQNMPQINVVDMKEEMRLGNRTIFSKDLFYAIEDRLERKEQTVLLVNRRGYASHVFCRACGYVATCRHCSVSMVFHRFARHGSNQKQKPEPSNKGFLSCHHCGYERANFKLCPNPECQSSFIKEYGLGTQKVEEQVHECFPTARVVRLDSDVTLKKGAFRDTLELFKRHEADILIGTQMVAKGLDIANVTLVGVLAADAALNMPDYRSTERGYQLLSQVAGRAGRGERPGEVYFQSYNNELEIFQAVKEHDFESFAQTELQSRESFHYPPFGRLLRIVFSSPDQNLCIQKCEEMVKDIAETLRERAKIPDSEFEVLGPAPCLVERIRGKFRYHLIVKIFSSSANAFSDLVEYLRAKTIGTIDKNVHIAVDVDAIDLI
ncbi:MAG: primosomal protein N' [Cyanobacteria bacterium TGS_CYA1]|nr:primosomal protein N' [Cyanobacteria bacterium TGS_CYA1]